MLQRRFLKLTRAALFAAVLFCLLCAHAPQTSAQNPAKQEAPTDLRELIPDVVVQDQDGRSLRFYSDLLKDKVFIINFIYASCRGTCLVLVKNLATLQSRLSDRDRKEVRLISISIDPANDSPQTLKLLSKNSRAKSPWTFVTGDTTSMEKLLRALIGDLPRKGEHSDAILIGDEAGGVLERRWGLTAPEKLTQTIKDLLAASRVRRGGAKFPASNSSRRPHE